MRALPLVVAAAAACALVAAYVALGGTSYEPSPVANPCAPRPPRTADGTGEQIEVVLLAAADSTACRLGVSREELVLALRSVDDLDALARKEGKSRDAGADRRHDGRRPSVRGGSPPARAPALGPARRVLDPGLSTPAASRVRR
jgi:hypothetical protein